MSEKPTFYIVLPLCVESEFDIFLNVLKCAVARTKFDENELVREFMAAINGKKFDIKTKDLTRNWMSMKSPSQQIRQINLIGFWTIKNFPTLSYKLFGETFQPQPRDDIFVVGNAQFESNKIDEIISMKMQLRVVELSVNESTFNKLKHFVKVPPIVGAKRSNEIRVSRKMISFDVDEDFVPICWDALKTGVFTMYNEVHFLFPTTRNQIVTKTRFFSTQ